MGRVVKFLLFLIGGFVALFLLAAVALYLFFDANDFRDDIAESVRNQTGRDVTIDGDISLEIFPWIAVKVGHASFGNAPGFGDEPMASFESASFSVRLLPAILRQEIVVGAADIESLRLNLQVDRRGDNNWSDLIAADSDDAAVAAEQSGGGLNINSIEVIDARFSYSDLGSGDSVTIDHANLNIGRLKDDGSEVPVTAELNFDVQPAGLVGAMLFKASIQFDAVSGELQLDNASVDGSIEGVASIPTGLRAMTDRITVSTATAEVTMDELDMSLFDMHVTLALQPFSYESELTLQGDIEIDTFSPRNVMHLFGVEAPLTADPAALGSVTIKAVAEMTPAAIALTDVAIDMDDTAFRGTLSIPRKASDFYRFDLRGDSIDLNRYMEPANEAATGSASESVPVEIPADLIAPLNARGKFQLATATLGDIVFENIELSANTSGGKMRIFPITSELFGGSYNGDVRIDVSGAVPLLSMNEEIAGVDLALLAKAMFDESNVTGTIGGEFALAGRGDDMAAIQEDLGGSMSLRLSDGTYEGTDVWYEIRRARALLKGEPAPQAVLPARTAFSTVSISGVVTDGVMSSDDLFAELPFMQLTGGGTVDIAAGTVDYGLVARVLERPEFLPGATAEELDEYTEAVIPLKITGPIDSPEVTPDLEKLLQQRVEDELEDLLKDKLKGLFD